MKDLINFINEAKNKLQLTEDESEVLKIIYQWFLEQKDNKNLPKELIDKINMLHVNDKNFYKNILEKL